MTIYDRRRFAAEPEAPDEDNVGEVGVADYIVTLFALDTYIRYLKENKYADDDVLTGGMTLVRAADRLNAEAIFAEVDKDLPTPSHKKMLVKAFNTPASIDGYARRALQIRGVLNKGGASTMRAIFQTNKALAAVREANEASEMDDADAALDKFAVIKVTNARFRTWIDKAAETAGSGTFQNPVAASSKETADDTASMLANRIRQQGEPLASESAVEAGDKGKDDLTRLQVEATDAAKAAMKVSGEDDSPPAKSEVVGIATAAAVAALTDPNLLNNVPEPLRKLDDEQRAAALTDGKVLVAAGAGAGKSTTLVSRVTYLVKDRKVPPSRIFVTSFNTKAANELKSKIGKAVGDDAFKQMSVGTTHGLCRRFIMQYGTPQEKATMGDGFVENGSKVAWAVTKAWKQIYGDESLPPTKTAQRFKSQWKGNNVTPQQARQEAEQSGDPEKIDCALWYEMYEGFKGNLGPNWEPPRRPDGNLPEEWDAFLIKMRGGGRVPLGDFDDMLTTFRNVLKRNPAVQKQVQSMYDHVMVDECQDLNEVQNDIVTMMTGHIGDGKDGKSLWMVGDDKQSIYGFRGARPDLFTELDGKEGWKTRLIRTNYRCSPEIVDAANRLISHNEKQIKMEANPDPRKSRGQGSIEVKRFDDEASTAISVVENIKSAITSDSASVSDFAILARTNSEMHSYETACIIRGIPYARKGSGSFLGSPETKTFLSYVQLVTGNDFKKMQAALGEVINKPNRFFISPDVGQKAVESALNDWASLKKMDLKSVNPLGPLSDRSFRELLADKLVGRGTRKYRFALESLEQLSDDIGGLREEATRIPTEADLDPSNPNARPPISTKEIFDEILNFRGKTRRTNPTTGETETLQQSFRESLGQHLKEASGSDEEVDDPDDDSADKKGLGNIAFLYQLAETDPTDPDDLMTPPDSPLGFKSKMERMAGRVRDLRIDLDKYEKEQSTLPADQRKPPPGVYVGTVHSVKGAQWPNCVVQMPKGKFPIEIRPKPGQPPPPPDEVKEQEEGERRLAYVALTRASQNLTVVCPNEVGGRPAGVSKFVGESGLQPGENVKKQTKEASWSPWASVEDIFPDEYVPDDLMPEYEPPATYGRSTYAYGRR